MTIWSKRDMEVAGDVLTQWQANHRGSPLRSVPYADAQESRCHENAAAYVRDHGGTVVTGFLVEHIVDADWIYIRAHSVVRRDWELVDPTLSSEQLKMQAFIEYSGSAEVFQKNSRQWAELRCSVMWLGNVSGASS